MLHVLLPPWNVTSGEVRARYEALLKDPVQDEYNGAAAAITQRLPDALGRSPSRERARLLFLPVSPFHLCAAASGRTPKDALGVSIFGQVRAMTTLAAGERPPRPLTCALYERMVEIVGGDERSVWLFPFSHYLRVAARHAPTTVYGLMGRGHLVGMEDRLPDWRDARRAGKLFLVPFYSPPTFHAPDTERERPVAVAESSSRHVACHRFDRFDTAASMVVRWGCRDAFMRDPARTRARLKEEVEAAGGVVQTTSSHITARHVISQRQGGAMAEKVRLYQSSRACVVPPGDTVVTPRLFSMIDALCVPLLAIDPEYLPFQQLPWANMTLSVLSRRVRAALADARAIETARRALLRWRGALTYPGAVHYLALELASAARLSSADTHGVSSV